MKSNQNQGDLVPIQQEKCISMRSLDFPFSCHKYMLLVWDYYIISINLWKGKTKIKPKRVSLKIICNCFYAIIRLSSNSLYCQFGLGYMPGKENAFLNHYLCEQLVCINARIREEEEPVLHTIIQARFCCFFCFFSSAQSFRICMFLFRIISKKAWFSP